MRKLLLLTVLFAATRAMGQESGEFISPYPENYFRNPVAIPMMLAGNFGECRPNHFHSGIDIKTNGKENLPVYAAAEGYISRIKMEKGGFGHALYITHPEGFTTLYAHLNNFVPPVQKYLKKVQYQKESWAVDIALTPEQFPVKKGEQIAWSGNTGGSTAPHLHFEIRDSQTEHPLNPQLFGFNITDTRPPVPTQLALYDLDQSIYHQTPQLLNLKRSGSTYNTVPEIVTVNAAKIGVGINVNDYMDGSANTLNFYTAHWYLDDVLQGSIRLDDIGYDVTRYLHAYIDYKSRKQKNEWYQLLFQLPGNRLNHIYLSLNNLKGGFTVADNEPHTIKIILRDAPGNSSTVILKVKAGEVADAPKCNDQLFQANQLNSFDHTNVKFTLDEQSLYDDACFKLSSQRDEKSFSERHHLQGIYVPIHKYFSLAIKSDKPVPFHQRDKIVLMYSDGKSEDGRAAIFENGWYKASVRNFGTYWLVADTIAPVIKPLQAESANLSKASRLSFTVTDNLTSIKSFRAELDGKWISFEPRGNTFFYIFDEHCPKGKHKLIVTASDENANDKIYVYTFTR